MIKIHRLELIYRCPGYSWYLELTGPSYGICGKKIFKTLAAAYRDATRFVREENKKAKEKEHE